MQNDTESWILLGTHPRKAMMVPKFRAWVPDHNDSWDGMSEVIQIDFEMGEVHVYPPNQDVLWDDVVLMMSTGMFDKHGQEVFEGDIVLADTSIPPEPFGDNPDPGEYRASFGAVTFHDGRFGADIEEFGDISLEQLIDETGAVEVIGNVHQHSYLLDHLERDT